MGVDYEVLHDPDIYYSRDADGTCEHNRHRITLALVEYSADSFETSLAYFQSVIRHEIIHAFFDEAGLDKYSEDEELVEALTKLAPRFYPIFKLGEKYVIDYMYKQKEGDR